MASHDGVAINATLNNSQRPNTQDFVFVFFSGGLPELHAERERVDQGAVEQPAVPPALQRGQGPTGDPLATFFQKTTQSQK